MVSSDIDARLRTVERELYRSFGLDPREHHVDVPKRSTRVRVVEIAGDDTRPPIVLLHGIASVTAAAIPLIPAFGGRRVLAIDFPGHGLSDPFTFAVGDVAEALADVVSAVVEALVEGRFDLVAHSLGGQTALTFVLAHPERVRRLVLLGAPGAAFKGVHPAPPMRMFAIPGLGRLVLSLPTSLPAYEKNAEGMLGPHAMDAHPAALSEVGWLASRRPGFAPGLASCFRGLLSTKGVRPGVAITLARLATIGVPTLMAWGDQDVFLRPDVGRASIDAIPGSTLLVIADAGHAPWLDEPHAVGKAVSEFLDAA